MVAELDIQFDPRQIASAKKMLADIPRGWPRAATRALNKTGMTIRSRTVKALSAETGMKQKDVRSNVNLWRASYRRLVASLRVYGRGIPLIRFAARQTKGGVTHASSDGRQLIPSAFIATMPSGYPGVFKRRGKSRLPIDQLFAPGLAEVFEKITDLAKRVTREAGDLLGRNLDTQVKLILDKQGNR